MSRRGGTGIRWRRSLSGPGVAACSLCALLLGGCEAKVPEDALVVTQVPLAEAAQPQTVLDARYPAGTRVVLIASASQRDRPRVLSRGLIAAGDPVVSSDGQRVVFAGRARASDSWQVFECRLTGGRPKALTAIPGGAMNPALLPNGDVVFSSPVPKIGSTWTALPAAMIYAQTRGQQPRRLTFGTTAAVEPTVLYDGRVLFISARPQSVPGGELRLGLFTMQSDGTEVTAFAFNDDGPQIVRRPRELLDGRVSFLTASAESAASLSADTVRKGRPFQSRGPLFSFAMSSCTAVEPEPSGALLVAQAEPGRGGAATQIFRVQPEATQMPAPLFHDPEWSSMEAVPAAPRPSGMSHMSSVLPGKTRGTVLCLDANFTQPTPESAGSTDRVQRVRFLASLAPGQVQTLGEMPVQPDGSFMAEVPADVALGFETLDARGRVLQRLPPFLWVRPGENRSCIGCHAPHNRSPRNVRPLAVGLPPGLLMKTPDARREQRHPL
jgi:hypothetical protein